MQADNSHLQNDHGSKGRMASGTNGMTKPTKRPIRIANCSGAKCDPGVHMLNQAMYGNCDVITGDYLAEINLAQNAEVYKAGKHPGYEETALEGLVMSLDVIDKKRIKVVINGGALNPKGLAEKVQEMVEEKKSNLKVAWVSGDDLMDRAAELLREQIKHLDAANSDVKLAKDTDNFLDDPKKPIVSCNAYLGARAINKGLKEGADIIICGRVSDASPVIGAAQWWHGVSQFSNLMFQIGVKRPELCRGLAISALGFFKTKILTVRAKQWSDTAYDELAGALIGGHLIECSTYSTGANFSGFFKYDTAELVDLSLPIVEIASSGECVVTKAESLRGYVTRDTITCQLLYELQGDIYLNSCVKADISEISITQESKNRVRVCGVKGFPPPATTKVAIFYRGGYQAELTLNATGYATSKKYDLFEAQAKSKLIEYGVYDKFQILEFQRVGVPAINPRTQLSSTTYLRIFMQSLEPDTIYKFLKAYTFNGMQHFAGFCCTSDARTASPIPYLAYYPGLLEQSQLHEAVHFLGASPTSYETGHPQVYEPLAPRRNFPPTHPVSISSFGEAVERPLGDIALGRSGDKGANVNLGLYIPNCTDEQWDWLRSFLTVQMMQELIGDDWRDDYWIERIEFSQLKAVHFVVYGILGRGVSSSSRLDNLGKGFVEYIRDVHVPIPMKFFI